MDENPKSGQGAPMGPSNGGDTPDRWAVFRGSPGEAWQKFSLSLQYPANFTELLVSLVYFIFSLHFFVAISRMLGRLFEFLFCLLPYYPLKDTQKPREGKVPPMRLFACFGLLCLFGFAISVQAFTYTTRTEGRFQAVAAYDPATGHNMYNFKDDWANRSLYLVVVPLYVGIGASVAYLCWSFQRQRTIRNIKNRAADDTGHTTVMHKTRPKFSGTTWQKVFWPVAALIFCLYFSSEYQRDVWNLLLVDYTKHFEKGDDQADKKNLKALPLYEAAFGSIPERTKNFQKGPILYWFLEFEAAEDCWVPPIFHMNEIKPNGVCYNDSGYYYLILNLGLLFFTVVSVLFFLSAAFSVIRLRQKIIDNEYKSFKDVYQDLRLYVLAFVFAKWLFLAYIVNTYIWRGSFLGQTDVVDTTIFAYTIIGSIILPIPNRVIETTWFARRRRAYLETPTKHDRPAFESLVPTGWPMVLKNVANLFIGIVFVDTVFNFQEIVGTVVKFATS